MEIKSEKLVIVGKSGSGKDFVIGNLISQGVKYSPKITTRPIRKGEVDGIHYKFTTNDNFLKLIDEGRIKTYQKFTISGEDWYYGIDKDNFQNNNLFVMTPKEISKLNEVDIMNSFIVYLDIDRKTREERIKNREDSNDSIQRRLDADELDFHNFELFDLRITDSKFEIDEIISLWN